MRFARFASVPFGFFARHSTLSPCLSAHTTRLIVSMARCLAVTLFLLAAAIPGFSQSDRGSIAGTVLDSSGAAVSGATVTATNANTGAVYKTTSTDTGAYRIPDMQVGVYNI